MKIIFVTHGQTLENAEGIIMGQLIGGELSPLGRSQVKGLAEKLKDAKIDCVYSSDLSRAVQTANEILKYHKNLQLNLTKDLRERNLGRFQGKKISEIQEFQEDRWYNKEYSNLETIKGLFSRVKKFLVQINKTHINDTVLLVGHRTCGEALECVMNGVPVSDFGTLPQLKNADIRIFEYNSKRVKSKF